MKHHTKDKGDLGVLKAQVDLYQKGYMILYPQTEHAPFDLVVYKDNQFKRIQVKYRELNQHGVLEVRFRSSYCNAHGVVMKDTIKHELMFIVSIAHKRMNVTVLILQPLTGQSA